MRLYNSNKNVFNNIFLAEQMKKWKPEDENNIWELSGLFQGDMMGMVASEKNGLLDEASKWPDAIVPYHIEEDDFSKFYNCMCVYIFI